MRYLALLCFLLPQSTQARTLPPLLIGDSIGCGSQYALSAVGVRTDCQVGRNWEQGVDVVNAYRADGRLPSRVVIEVSTNGPISLLDVRHMVGALRGVPHIYAFTCYVAPPPIETWSGMWPYCPRGLRGNNAVLHLAQRDWHRLRLIRWDLVAAQYVGGPPSVAGVHPDVAGQHRLAAMVAAALRR